MLVETCRPPPRQWSVLLLAAAVIEATFRGSSAAYFCPEIEVPHLTAAAAAIVVIVIVVVIIRE